MKFTTSSEANNKQTGGQEIFFGMNCPIINLWNKQTVLRRNFFQWKQEKAWKASENSSWVTSKKTGNAKKTNDNINVLFEFPEFLEEVD